MNGGCLCGRVTVEVPGRPDYLNECNCAFCIKLGAMWGYYPESRVVLAGPVASYVREDVADPALRAQFCGTCGATTSWTPNKPDMPDRMAVNMRLFDPAGLAGIELRFGNRRDHDAVEPRHYYRAATTFDGLGATA
jgi:hypothetical protein